MRDRVITLVELILEACRSHREKEKSEIPPYAFLVVSDVWNLPFAQDKDLVANYIRYFSAKMGASYVIIATEGWIAEARNEEEKALISLHFRENDSLENFEGRQEVIVVSVDGPDLSRSYRIPIQEDGSLGETRMESTVGAEGRMVNLSGRMGEN
jgi:hypothetical protein